MNSVAAKYINIALGAALIIIIALFMRGVVVPRYTALQLMDAATEQAQGSDARSTARQVAVRFAPYAGIVEGGLFAPAGVFKLLGGGAVAGKTSARTDAALSTISLAGTVVGQQGVGGYGLFKNKKSNKQDIFKIGDMVFEVGRLTHVDRLTATIVQAGVSYTLYMPKHSNTAGAPVASPGRRGGRGRSLPFGSSGGAIIKGRPPIGGGEGRILARRTGERDWTVDKRALSEALSDTGNLFTQARILPYRVRGKTEGFRLSSVQRRGIFALIGLRSGDILLKVNERAIDSPEKGLELLSGLGGETSISLDILRGGKPEKLNYEIR